ncbi:hypothetical protein IQ63_37875 [Streptomyces acidiscabies]|uniref:Uncharacterized protein n=1 Tax=Streptomyces acidiscabies TaxID=42234 RepID=A0A0L0JK65_9ACTN|nr:hypothetical protein IQ63_37875 [Streptomyces acidiscabies]
MFSRFNFIPVLRGHWKGLTDGRYAPPRPDVLARLALLIPAIVFLLMWLKKGNLSTPSALLTGIALLAGGMLSAFTHLSTLRLKLKEWVDASEASRYEVEKGMLDETAAHLLTGSLLCAFDVASLVIGMNVSMTKEGHLYGFWAALSAAISSYVLVIFTLLVPRLYSAYVEINDVSPDLNGFVSRKTKNR